MVFIISLILKGGFAGYSSPGWQDMKFHMILHCPGLWSFFAEKSAANSDGFAFISDLVLLFCSFHCSILLAI
jgi:hypothetical protein